MAGKSLGEIQWEREMDVWRDVQISERIMTALSDTEDLILPKIVHLKKITDPRNLNS